jgi:hypothetical protein
MLTQIKRLISFFILTPKCNPLCAPHNHVLHRWHLSCLTCTTRKTEYNKKYAYNAKFAAWLPKNFDCLTAILNNGTGYIIYYDLDRFAAPIKQVLLEAIFARADRCGNAEIAKKLFTISELLCI